MRNTLIGALGFGLAILAAPPAFSQSAPIAETAWEQFLEGSYSPYGDTTVPTWEDKLYVLVEAHPEGTDIIPRFAEALGVPVGQAEIYARLIVGSVLSREQQTADCAPACLFVPGSDLYELARTHAPMETSGELLYAMGENLFSQTTRDEQAAYLDLVLRHPARAAILSRLYGYTEDASLLTFLVLQDPAAPEVLDAVRGSAINISSYEPDDWGGWLETALAIGLEKLAQSGAAPDDQAAYVQLLASRYLALGLRERALDLYLGQPEAVRERLPLAPACAGERNCGGQSLWFVDEMSAALWLDGRREAADALLARTGPELEALRDTEALQRRAALDDAMRPSHPDASLFDLLVDGDPALIRKDDYPSSGGEGWFSLRPGPAGSLLLTKRVRTAGYSAMAEDMAGRPGIYRSPPEHWQESLIAALEDRFSPEFVARRRALSQDIEQAWAASPGPAAHITPSTPALLPEWREARLPPGVAPWVDDRTADRDDGPSPTADALPGYLSRIR